MRSHISKIIQGILQVSTFLWTLKSVGVTETFCEDFDTEWFMIIYIQNPLCVTGWEEDILDVQPIAGSLSNDNQKTKK